jgi:hypothetical protein
MADTKKETEYHEVVMPSGNVAVNAKFDDGSDMSMTIRAIPANALGSILPERAAVEAANKLSVQENREKANRWIDDAEREIALIRQGIGKWPKSTVDGRMEGLRHLGGFCLNLDVPELMIGTREHRLKYVEQRLKRYREELNETAGLRAASSTAALEPEPVRGDEEKAITTRRIYAWAAAVGSGATGWYLTLAAAGVFPRMGSWVADFALLTSAVVAWIFCITPLGKDMDAMASKLASRGPYLRRDQMRKKEKRIAKWLMVPFVIWWLPILLAFAGSLVRD